MGQKDVEDMFAERMAVCRKCPELQSGFLKSPTCGMCGCKLSLKARMPGQECPLRKWLV